MSKLSTGTINEIDRKVSQLVALLAISSSEDFHEFSDATKSSYLWACSDLANDIKRVFDDATKIKGACL